MGALMQFGDCFVIGLIPITQGSAATFRALASARTLMRGHGILSDTYQEV
jgi:hypothetical protein